MSTKVLYFFGLVAGRQFSLSKDLKLKRADVKSASTRLMKVRRLWAYLPTVSGTLRFVCKFLHCFLPFGILRQIFRISQLIAYLRLFQSILRLLFLSKVSVQNSRIHWTCVFHIVPVKSEMPNSVFQHLPRCLWHAINQNQLFKQSWLKFVSTFNIKSGWWSTVACSKWNSQWCEGTRQTANITRINMLIGCHRSLHIILAESNFWRLAPSVFENNKD